jgi:hypothetical protein
MKVFEQRIFFEEIQETYKIRSEEIFLEQSKKNAAFQILQV